MTKTYTCDKCVHPCVIVMHFFKPPGTTPTKCPIGNESVKWEIK